MLGICPKDEQMISKLISKSMANHVKILFDLYGLFDKSLFLLKTKVQI